MKIILKVIVNHKPVSINEAYYLRKGKTKSRKYIDYQAAWALVLCDHKLNIKKEDKLRVDYEWGFSSVRSDVDNPIKPTQDTLQNYYGFNDSQIYHVRATKKLVKKGEEYAKVTMRILK